MGLGKKPSGGLGTTARSNRQRSVLRAHSRDVGKISTIPTPSKVFGILFATTRSFSAKADLSQMRLSRLGAGS